MAGQSSWRQSIRGGSDRFGARRDGDLSREGGAAGVGMKEVGTLETPLWCP